jgi:hypothetical protein
MSTPSISPTNTMADWSDSLYFYVRSRIIAINANRKFGGIISALDWPLKEAQIGSFYMMATTLEPVRTSSYGGNSWSGPMYTERIQWVWQLIGTDIQQGNRMANRGDRYRLHYQMIQELLSGIYPGYCEIKQFAASDNTQLPEPVSYSPKEFIRMSKPSFGERIDTSTGILFGSATMQLSSFSPAITA